MVGWIQNVHKQGIIFDIAADLELGRYEPKARELTREPRFWDDYADWKLLVGLTYRWSSFPSWDKERQTQEKQQQKQQQESDDIQQQREDVIKELQEYQKRLEEEDKKNVPL